MKLLFACLLLLSATLGWAQDAAPTAQSFRGQDELWDYELVWLDGAPEIAAIIVTERANDTRDLIQVKSDDGKASLRIGGKPVAGGTVLYYEHGFVRNVDVVEGKGLYAAITKFRAGDKAGFEEFVRKAVARIRS